MRKATSGFTIVELLIVIVVIAILAAISIVAYNGIQDRTSDSVVQSDLSALVKKVKLATVKNDGVPPAVTEAALKPLVSFSKTQYMDNVSASTVTYCRTNDAFSFYARSKSGQPYVGSSKGGVKVAPWVGSVNGQCAEGLPGVATTDPGYATIALLVGQWAEDPGWLSWIE